MIQKPKGTIDIYGSKGENYIYIQRLLMDICEKYNYKYIKTPTFENSNLFHRGIGETTDIIRKETYDFKDKGDRDLTLKPEGTAGVIRSYIENKMYADNKLSKFFYFSQAFRYERPQAGRLREHTQFGIEVLGIDNILIDVEVLSIAINIMKFLNIKDYKLKINCLGSNESRENYKKILTEYFLKNTSELCEDCNDRLEKNPLRILDCKVDSNNELIKKAPKIIDYLDKDSKENFELLKSYLDTLEISYEVDPNLVRGLDYYSHLVFEIQADVDGFGSQNTILAGGRYNSLVKSLDGPDLPGIGFGMGMERLLLLIENLKLNLFDNRVDLFVGNISTHKDEVYSIINELRLNGFKVETNYDNENLKSCFKLIEKLNPKYFAFIGDDEMKSFKVKIKDNDTKEETEVELYEIVNYLDWR